MISDATPKERDPAWPTIGVVLAGVAWLGLRAANLLIAPRCWAEEVVFVSAAYMASRESVTYLPHCPEGRVIKVFPQN